MITGNFHFSGRNLKTLIRKIIKSWVAFCLQTEIFAIILGPFLVARAFLGIAVLGFLICSRLGGAERLKSSHSVFIFWPANS